MKLVIKIAKNELRNLFFSPVAWFVTIVFLLMCAFFYTSIIYPWAKQTHLILQNNPDFAKMATGSATAGIFQGFFGSILPNLYLFVPLLTMSILSREVNNGTIKLLYSSPVKLRQIVLGKYLALMIYNLILVSLTGIFIVSGFFDIRSLEYPQLLSAILGFYLLLCALTAIGLFMSSLTTYPIVSAIASFTIPFILAWYFPVRENYWHGDDDDESYWIPKRGPLKGKRLTNYYGTRFKNAWEVASHTAGRLSELESKTRSFTETFFSSSLPPYVLEAVSSQASILRTNTCMLLEGKQFFGFEGCGDDEHNGWMNCSHVWNYEQALPFLFPELERSARAGDSIAAAAFERGGQAVGLAIAAAAAICDLDLAVIGGGIARADDLLFDPIRRALAVHAGLSFLRGLRVVRAERDDSGLVGAAALALLWRC